MIAAEQVYRYPRRITWLFEVLAAVVVALAALNFGQELLRWLWATFGLDRTLVGSSRFLFDLVGTVRGELALPVLRTISLPYGLGSFTVAPLTDVLPSLGWLALALLLALVLRNSLPTVRTNPRGLLVEFAGDWLPLPWNSFRAIKVTEDVSGERFVLLAETEAGHLTGWHRLYNFIYRFGFRPGFLISSRIENFDQLLKLVLDENQRVARLRSGGKPAPVQETASSPFFRFLLSPAAFFSQRTKAEAVPVAPTRTPAPVAPTPTTTTGLRGTYPPRITTLFHWGTLILGALLFVRFIITLLEFLALTFQDLLQQPVFNRLTLRQAQLAAPWWLPVAGLLTLLLVGLLLVAVRNLLPEVEARTDGLAVRAGGHWSVVPWARITTLKMTDLSEDSQVVLVQARGGLPFASRFASLLYDGSFTPGVLMTSALSNFEPLIERIILEVSQQKTVDTGAPLMRPDSFSPLLMLILRAGTALDRLVEASRANDSATTRDNRRFAEAARPMVALALIPALLLFCERALRQGLLPDTRMIITTALFFVIGLLEWPIVAIGAQTLDESTGGGEEGYRPFYLYPLVQLPRVLPLLGALVLTLLGVPVLPVLLWFVAMAWSFVLAAGLWESLYNWKGNQLVAGGLFPVVFQLLMLVAFLFAARG